MWARNGRWILPEMPDFHVAFRNLLHAVNLRHGTDGFTSPTKEGVLRIFSPWKIRRLRPGLNPRNWVPKASTLPLDHRGRFLTDSWFLLYDNAPAHRTGLVKDFSAKNNLTSMQYFPYSPDLAPADFHLFPRLKLALKGRSFCNTTDIRNVTEELKRRIQYVFQECLQQLYSRWQTCIVAQKDYFKGNVAYMITLLCTTQKCSDSGNIWNYHVERHN